MKKKNTKFLGTQFQKEWGDLFKGKGRVSNIKYFKEFYKAIVGLSIKGKIRGVIYEEDWVDAVKSKRGK